MNIFFNARVFVAPGVTYVCAPPDEDAVKRESESRKQPLIDSADDDDGGDSDEQQTEETAIES